MADEKKGEDNIPSWQRAQQITPDVQLAPESQSETETTPSSTPSDVEPPEQLPETSLATLREQAAKFLEDGSIKNESRDKKAAFLLSKGLSKTDIDALLPSPPEPEPSVTPTPIPASSWSRSFSASQSQKPTPVASPVPKEVPPIITYPEFLAKPQKQPPLVTFDRLVKTAYIAGGAAAALHALNRFIVQPMTDTLSGSRHDLFAHTTEKLGEMNEKLESVVTVVPVATTHHDGRPPTRGRDEDVESVDEDPTELFHRDMGTQTSPGLSRRNSSSNTSTDTNVAVPDRQAARLTSINSSLRDLLETSEISVATTGTLKNKVSDLTTYLNELSYSAPSYSLYDYGGYARGGGGGGGYGKGKDDGFDGFKSEIRSVKGVFLSARNFPRQV